MTIFSIIFTILAHIRQQLGNKRCLNVDQMLIYTFPINYTSGDIPGIIVVTDRNLTKTSMYESRFSFMNLNQLLYKGEKKEKKRRRF